MKDKVTTLPKTSVHNEDKCSISTPQRVRVRLPCISFHMTFSSDRLHFWTTSEFGDEDFWNRFRHGAALWRQSWWCLGGFNYNTNAIKGDSLMRRHLLNFILVRFPTAPLLARGHPGNSWPWTAHWSSSWDHSSWAFDQAVVQILIANKAGLKKIKVILSSLNSLYFIFYI